MDRWTDGLMGGWRVGLMGGWRVGLMGGWRDGLIDLYGGSFITHCMLYMGDYFLFFLIQFCIDLLTGTFYMNVFVFFYNDHVIWSLPLCEGEENNVIFKLAHFYFTRLLQ